MILRSPHPRARLIRIDTSRALRKVGVKAVVTAADTPKVGYGPYRKDKWPLATDKVRFIGDEVAALAATDEELAEEALDLIDVEYELLPAVYEPEEAMTPEAPLIHEVEGNVSYEFHVKRGDIEAGFKKAEVIVEETYTTPSVHQCYLEPLSCLAQMDHSGKLQLYGSYKDLFAVRHAVALTTGIDEGRIRAVQTHVGGGFGSRGCDLFSFFVAAALLARKADRPILMQNSRDLEFIAGRPRVPSKIKIKLGLDAQGYLLAKQASIIADAGAYTGLAPRIMETMTRRADCMYRLSNVKNDSYLVFTNKTPMGAFRGFGNPQMTFALESSLDMAAAKLSLDPAEVRFKNAAQKGDVTIHGWKLASCGLQDCIGKAEGAADWKGKRANRKAGQGLGMGCMIHVSGRRQSPGFFGSRALVKITEDGKVNVISGEGEVGQGWYTVAALIASEEMGVPLTDVQVLMPDTDVAPFCHGPFSDRTTLLGGNAVRLAVQDAKEKVLRLAGEMLEAKPADLVINQGKVQVRGVPAKGLALAEVASFALTRRDGRFIWGQGDYDPPSEFPDPTTVYGNVSTSYTFASQVAEVEVDPDTGKVVVTNFIGAHDLGRAIFPQGAQGQIEGAAAQGIGWGSWENMVFDNGVTLNANFLDYRVPTALDMPLIRPILVETIDPYGPFGAKGVAEPGLVPVAPAVANAIFDALGVRITSLPITPDKILAALERTG
jgi:CO/xanthine dehydrogenase Mo-binding subunit